MPADSDRKPPRSLSWVARRLGLGVRPIAEHGWLLSAGRGLRIETLDRRTWMVQRRGRSRRVVKRLGVGPMRTHLVFDPAVVRKRTNRFLGMTNTFLCEQHIAWLMRRLDINVVLDVGANTGQFAQMLRSSGYTGRIVSFEPVPHALEELQRNAEADPDWHVRDCALGAEDGTAEINVSPGTVSSLLPASDFGRTWSDKLAEAEPLPIDVSRLDGLLVELLEDVEDPRVYLKMDTQGFDLEVVKGAGERIQDVLGLQSEVAFVSLYDGMPRLPEQVEAYESAGFAVSGIYSVSRHAPTMRAIESDLLMVRPGAVRPE